MISLTAAVGATFAALVLEFALGRASYYRSGRPALRGTRWPVPGEAPALSAQHSFIGSWRW